METVIEAKDTNSDLFLNESADLLFHLMILLQAKGQSLNDVVRVLEERQKGLVLLLARKIVKKCSSSLKQKNLAPTTASGLADE